MSSSSTGGDPQENQMGRVIQGFKLDMSWCILTDASGMPAISDTCSIKFPPKDRVPRSVPKEAHSHDLQLDVRLLSSGMDTRGYTENKRCTLLKKKRSYFLLLPQKVSQTARTNKSHSLQCRFGGRACQLSCSWAHLELNGMISASPISLRVTTQIDLVGFNSSFTADVCGSQAIRDWFYVLMAIQNASKIPNI